MKKLEEMKQKNTSDEILMSEIREYRNKKIKILVYKIVILTIWEKILI